MAFSPGQYTEWENSARDTDGDEEAWACTSLKGLHPGHQSENQARAPLSGVAAGRRQNAMSPAQTIAGTGSARGTRGGG